MNHEHNHNHSRLGWTVILNISITIAEYIGGMLSGSLALLSDAGHNLTDVLSLLLGYVGEKVSLRKANKKHTFGFKRFEVITALINAFALLAVAFYILFEAFHRLKESRSISLGLMLGIGSIGLLGNLASILILHKQKNESLNLKSAYLHLFYDTLSSVFVMLGAVIIYFTNYVVIDVIASVVIALMILYSSFKIIKKGLHIFMQGVPEGLDLDEIYTVIKGIEGVASIHNLHIWSINSKDTFLSCHICIEYKKVKNDELIKEINNALQNRFKIEHSAIQIEENNICKK